jgi:hypothetical protein
MIKTEGLKVSTRFSLEKLNEVIKACGARKQDISIDIKIERSKASLGYILEMSLCRNDTGVSKFFMSDVISRHDFDDWKISKEDFFTIEKIFETQDKTELKIDLFYLEIENGNLVVIVDYNPFDPEDQDSSAHATLPLASAYGMNLIDLI